MVNGIAEILEECSKIDKRYGRLTFLQQNSSQALKAVLGFCFDPKIKWLLPEGDPPYEPNKKSTDSQNVLLADHRKLHIFVESVEYKDLRDIKREQLFIQFLEELDPDDARLMLSIKNKKMPYKGITSALVKDAFPNLAKDW
tara:strand:- start:2340 stop:2765 length:426 start_codon:yes stop_codon:yes gene_type:complete